jgi:hypothetical protein
MGLRVRAITKKSYCVRIAIIKQVPGMVENFAES